MEGGNHDHRLRYLLAEPLPEPRRRGWLWLAALAFAAVAALAAWAVYLVASLGGSSGDGEQVATPATVAAAPPANPGPRVFGALEYDAGRGEVLLVGGQVSRRGELAAGALRFDGEQWRAGADAPFLDRTGHATAHVDSLAGTMVMGGGIAPFGPCPGGWCTRSLDGGAWLLAGTEGPVELAGGPSSRFGHDIAYNRNADVVVLFGGVTAVTGSGRTGEVLGDTWVYDPVTDTWEDATTASGPAPRAFHQMVTDPATGRVLLWGGRASDPRASDVTFWAFDAGRRAWERIDVAGPGPRWLHQMAADPVSGRIVLLGGEAIVERSTEAGTISERACVGEIWELDPAAPAWTEREHIDGAICGHAFAPDGTGKMLAVQGPEVGLYDPVTRTWTALAPLA